MSRGGVSFRVETEVVQMTTVLIADDSKFMRGRCVSLVQELGYETVEAEDGRQAVQLYTQAKPQLVLLDITMPEVDGLAALQEIMVLDPSARIAMVTAIDQQRVAMDALKAGARDFVVKPYEPDKLKATLQKLARNGNGYA